MRFLYCDTRTGVRLNGVVPQPRTITYVKIPALPDNYIKKVKNLA